MPENPYYGLNPLARLHWAVWDDEFVVFDEASGQTHQMDALRGFVLDVLIEKICSFDQLLHQVSSIIDPAAKAEIPVTLDVILDDFLKYGLVEVKAA